MNWKNVKKIDAHIHILPELIELYGIEQTNRILRMFGAERLIFCTIKYNLGEQDI